MQRPVVTDPRQLYFDALAEIERMKAAADIEARVLKEVASGIRDVFPETSRIIELSAANLAALGA